MNKICIYTICKNEEINVLRYLESYKYVDLMVVVDTGSTDRTVELFKSSNLPQLHLYQEIIEPFSFAEARNRCLNYTRELIGFENLKDWIFLNFDMDEFLVSPEALNNLRFMKLPSEPSRLFPELVNCDPPIYVVNRIHTDNGLIKWENDLHERLLINEEVTPERITGLEYIHESKNTPEKYSLYGDLLENMIKRDPNNFWAYDYLLDYISLGYIEKTKEEKEKIIKAVLNIIRSKENVPANEKVQALLTGIYWNVEDGDKLVEELNDYVEKQHIFKTKSYYYIIGTFFEEKDPRKALQYYQELVKLDEKDPSYLSGPDLFKSVSKACIYNKMCLISYYTLNDIKSAIGYAALTYKEEPTDFNFDNMMICIESLK